MSSARLIRNAILTAFVSAAMMAAANAQSPPPIPPGSIGTPSPSPQIVMPPAPREPAPQFPTPPAPRAAPEPKSETRAAPRPQPRIIRPANPANQPAATQPVAAPPVASAPATTNEHELDLAYGAYQRGYYLSAFNQATVRIEKF